VVLDENVKAHEPRRLIAESNASEFCISPSPQKDGFYVAMYIPEACNSWGAWDLDGRAAEVSIYHVSSSSSEIIKTSSQLLPRKLNGVELKWNSEGTALLAQANSDVDETGESYFGTSTLYWMKSDGKAQCKVCGPEDGLVQDVAWAPGKNEFLMIIGMMPATTKLYDGTTGKMVKDGNLGTSRRNTIRWNPFGRFFVVGGFGALPGDLDFFDRPSGETLCSFRASLTVQCCWAPAGRHFLTCTTAPRMNEDNQISVWDHLSGDRIFKVDFKPALDVAGGGRKAADAGAMLWASTWRPDGKKVYEDIAAGPPAKGVKRVKGLPADSTGAGAGGGGAWRLKGSTNGGGIAAAMMRGELEAPPAAGGWGNDGAPPPTGGDPKSWEPGYQKPKTWQELEQEQKEWQKEKKAMEKRRKEEEEKAAEDKKAAQKALEKSIADKDKNKGSRLVTLKAEIAELQKLKDKEWDELTEEDEAQLELEMDLLAELAELEKKA